MFGVTEEELIDGLEAIRRRHCVYGASLEESCDCRFGIADGTSHSSEQTGCPELRQAIKVLQGKYEEIFITAQLAEESAARTLRQVVAVLVQSGVAVKAV